MHCDTPLIPRSKSRRELRCTAISRSDIESVNLQQNAAHIQAFLDEFVFRWNQRRHYRSAFDTLLGIGLRTSPMDYWTLIGRPSPRHAASAI